MGVGTVAVVALVSGAAAMAVIAALAERWARTRGLERATTVLRDRLRAGALRLDVPARPLLPGLLRDAGTAAHLVAHDVPVGDDGGHLADLDVRVPGVRLRPGRRVLETADGSFTALVGQEDLGRIVTLPGVVSRLELRTAGLRVWTVLAVPIDAEVAVADHALVVIPDPLQVSRLLELPGLSAFRRTVAHGGVRLGLPDLPLGAAITGLVFGDGEVTVTGTVPVQRLTLGRTGGADQNRRP